MSTPTQRVHGKYFLLFIFRFENSSTEILYCNELKKETNINRAHNWNLFLQSVNEVLEKTKNLNVDFLIENNVLAKMNVYHDGTNPIFCVDGAEMDILITSINNPRLGI